MKQAREEAEFKRLLFASIYCSWNVCQPSDWSDHIGRFSIYITSDRSWVASIPTVRSRGRSNGARGAMKKHTIPFAFGREKMWNSKRQRRKEHPALSHLNDEANFSYCFFASEFRFIFLKPVMTEIEHLSSLTSKNLVYRVHSHRKELPEIRYCKSFLLSGHILLCFKWTYSCSICRNKDFLPWTRCYWYWSWIPSYY